MAPGDPLPHPEWKNGAVYIGELNHPFEPRPVERVRLRYNPQSDSLEGWVDDVIIAAERPGCPR